MTHSSKLGCLRMTRFREMLAAEQRIKEGESHANGT